MENMQRRSFFSSLFATAAVTAVAVEAKPLAVSNHTVAAKPDSASMGTVGVRVYSGYGCAFCGSAMMNFHNLTMRCCSPECPNFDKPVRLPVFCGELVNSDEEEVIRHALIILNVMIPGEAVSRDDFKMCSEVVARIVRDMNAEPEQRSWRPYTAKDIRPYELADALKPYYDFGKE